MGKDSEKTKLIPPDTKRCQAEKPNGLSFMSLGGQPGLVRCRNIPIVVITEIVPKVKSEPQGSMSLCPWCWKVYMKQEGMENVTVEPILDPLIDPDLRTK